VLEKYVLDSLYTELVEILNSITSLIPQGSENQIIEPDKNGSKNIGKASEESKVTPNRMRTSFYLGEYLSEDENDVNEYKQYYYPFSEVVVHVLKKTICSFLDRVNDYKQVVGIKL